MRGLKHSWLLLYISATVTMASQCGFVPSSKKSLGSARLPESSCTFHLGSFGFTKTMMPVFYRRRLQN